MTKRTHICLLTIAAALLCLTVHAVPAWAFAGYSLKKKQLCTYRETPADFVGHARFVLWGKLKKFEYEDGYWKITLTDLDPFKGVAPGTEEFVFYLAETSQRFRMLSTDKLSDDATLIGEEDDLVPNGTYEPGKQWLEKKHFYVAALNPTWPDKDRILFVGDAEVKETGRERNIQLHLPDDPVCTYSSAPVAFTRAELERYVMFLQWMPYAPYGGGAILLAGWLAYWWRSKGRKTAPA